MVDSPKLTVSLSVPQICSKIARTPGSVLASHIHWAWAIEYAEYRPPLSSSAALDARKQVVDDSLAVLGQILESPCRRIVVLVPKVEALQPLDSLTNIVVGPIFGDGFGDDSPLPR